MKTNPFLEYESFLETDVSCVRTGRQICRGTAAENKSLQFARADYSMVPLFLQTSKVSCSFGIELVRRRLSLSLSLSRSLSPSLSPSLSLSRLLSISLSRSLSISLSRSLARSPALSAGTGSAARTQQHTPDDDSLSLCLSLTLSRSLSLSLALSLPLCISLSISLYLSRAATCYNPNLFNHSPSPLKLAFNFSSDPTPGERNPKLKAQTLLHPLYPKHHPRPSQPWKPTPHTLNPTSHT